MLTKEGDIHTTPTSKPPSLLIVKGIVPTNMLVKSAKSSFTSGFWRRGPGSKVLHCWFWILHPGRWNLDKNRGSCNLDPEPWMQDLGSREPNTAIRVQDAVSWIFDPRNWFNIVDSGPCIEDHASSSWIQGAASRILDTASRTFNPGS